MEKKNELGTNRIAPTGASTARTTAEALHTNRQPTSGGAPSEILHDEDEDEDEEEVEDGDGQHLRTTDEVHIRRIPKKYCCPISLRIMRDPVLAADGVSYERSEFISWMKSGNTTSPGTGREIKTKLLHKCPPRSMILEWERMNTEWLNTTLQSMQNQAREGIPNLSAKVRTKSRAEQMRAE